MPDQRRPSGQRGRHQKPGHRGARAYAAWRMRTLRRDAINQSCVIVHQKDLDLFAEGDPSRSIETTPKPDARKTWTLMTASPAGSPRIKRLPALSSPRGRLGDELWHQCAQMPALTPSKATRAPRSHRCVCPREQPNAVGHRTCIAATRSRESDTLCVPVRY